MSYKFNPFTGTFDLVGSSNAVSLITFTGTIDGYNLTFTASATPTVIFTDQGFWVQNGASGFSLSGLTVTLPIAPGSNRPDPSNGWVIAI